MMQMTEHTAAPLLRCAGAGFMTPFTRQPQQIDLLLETAALLPWGMN